MKRHTNFIDRTGEKHLTNEGYEIKIIEYFGWNNCTIQFGNRFILKEMCYGNIKKGIIKNPFHPSVLNIGYIGYGEHKVSIKSDVTIAYKTWRGMFRRCYDFKYHERQPSYIGCTVDEKWHNFQVFAEWFEENYIEGWALDKDILIKGNKIYSPETCCFIPQEINSLFTKRENKRGNYPIGVNKELNKFKASINIKDKRVYLGMFLTPEEAFQAYKIAKEQHIKNLADGYTYKLKGDVYNALYNYKVEITD